MKHDYKVISKGLYEKTVGENDILTVKQYIFIREKNKKYLMLRFLNNSNFVVNSFEFWIVQKNSDGVEIAQNKIRIKDSLIRPGEIFSPEKGFRVNDKCVSFEIKFIVMNSGKYEYRIKDDEVFVRYPIAKKWLYKSRKRENSYQLSKANKKVRFTAIILWVAIIALLGAILWPLISEVIWPIFKEWVVNLFESNG